MPLQDKLKRATRVIWNDGDREALSRAIEQTWQAAGLPGNRDAQ
jgi:hypothetical protein